MRILPTVLSLLVALSIWCPAISNAQDDDRQKPTTELFRATGMDLLIQEIISTSVERIIAELKEKRPGLHPDAFVIIREELVSGFNKQTHSLIAKYEFLYRKHYSDSELQAIADFYQTPAGKKSISVLPLIFSESLDISDEWIEKNLPKILDGAKERLREKGYTR